jgi:hypothetical protein
MVISSVRQVVKGLASGRAQFGRLVRVLDDGDAMETGLSAPKYSGHAGGHQIEQREEDDEAART